MISSQAAFELALTKTQPLVVDTIWEIAATKVRVFPVPVHKRNEIKAFMYISNFLREI